MAVSDLRRLMNQPVELDISESRAPSGDGGTALSQSHILEAALANLHEQGYEATTIRAIAGRLDCAVGSIYRYFPDKRSLVRQCGERLLQPVVEHLEAGDATLGTSKRQYIAAARANEELYRQMFWLVDADQRLPAVVERILAGWAELLGDDAAARLHWATVHATVLLGREVNVQSTGAATGPHAAGRASTGRDAAGRGADDAANRAPRNQGNAPTIPSNGSMKPVTPNVATATPTGDDVTLL